MNRPVHTTDEECTLGPDRCCLECGTLHGEPCAYCAGAGFHKADCLDELAAEWCSAPKHEALAPLLTDGAKALEFGELVLRYGGITAYRSLTFAARAAANLKATS